MGRTSIANIKGPPGDSAYTVAVKNGFVGTEAEWLESLSTAGIIDPISGLPPEPIVKALATAVLADHRQDPNPHPTYELSLLDSYRLGKS